MPQTPTSRNLRSNSNTQSITLQDIKTLIETSKADIIKAVDCKVEKLNETIVNLMNCVEVLQKKQSVLEEKCLSLEEKIMIIQKENLDTEDLLKEAEDRNARREFLVVSGIPECNVGSPADRKAHDRAAINEIMNRIGIKDLTLEDLWRIGKSDTRKPRLLRFKCKDVNQKFRILHHSRDLRNHAQYRNIYINSDFTKLQREKNKELRTELKRRRELGEKVQIQRGVIVNSAPTVPQTSQIFR